MNDSGPDPADANMAPVADISGQGAGTYSSTQGSTRLMDSNGRVVDAPLRYASQGYAGQPSTSQGYVSQGQSQQYPGNGAPIERREPSGMVPQGEVSGAQYDSVPGYSAAQQPVGSSDWTESEQDAYNQVTEEADAAPPPLPVYEQPPAPAPNYLWTPGYWSYAPAGYYWVPGAWVAAPFAGALWTPGYWGVWHRHYGYHPGFWGRYVGFYGGVAYGFGYYGSGYHGGYWRGNDFYYNQAVNRVNVVNVRNVYNRSVVVNNTVINNTVINNRVVLNRASYNGPGGVEARPRPAEIAAYRTPRVAPMTAQLQNQRTAAENRQQFFGQNQGRPAIAAAPRPFAADRGMSVPAVRSNVELARGSQAGAVELQQRSQGVRAPEGGLRPGQQVSGMQGRQNVEAQRLQGQQRVDTVRMTPGQGRTQGVAQDQQRSFGGQQRLSQQVAPANNAGRTEGQRGFAGQRQGGVVQPQPSAAVQGQRPSQELPNGALQERGLQQQQRAVQDQQKMQDQSRTQDQSRFQGQQQRAVQDQSRTQDQSRFQGQQQRAVSQDGQRFGQQPQGTTSQPPQQQNPGGQQGQRAVAQDQQRTADQHQGNFNQPSQQQQQRFGGQQPQRAVPQDQSQQQPRNVFQPQQQQQQQRSYQPPQQQQRSVSEPQPQQRNFQPQPQPQRNYQPQPQQQQQRFAGQGQQRVAPAPQQSAPRGGGHPAPQGEHRDGGRQH